jgi:hypothetical protein
MLSPDRQCIAFITGNKLKKISAQGGVASENEQLDSRPPMRRAAAT